MSVTLEEMRDTRLSTLGGIIKDRCVVKNSDTWMVSTTGAECSWLIDMRQTLLDPFSLELISTLFWDEHERYLPFQLCGLEVSGIPLLVGLLHEARRRNLNVNGFIVRKERKQSGIGKIIEGKVTGERVLVVDDILNSAASMEKIRVALEAHDLGIYRVFVIVDYEALGGGRWQRNNKIRVASLFSLKYFELSLRIAKPLSQNLFSNEWAFKCGEANHFHVVPKSSPKIAEDTVFFGSDRGSFWALDLPSGTPKWEFSIKTKNRKGIWSRPATGDGVVYFGGYDGNLYCLSMMDGTEIWRWTGAEWIGSSPILSSDRETLWIGLEYETMGSKGGVTAFNAKTGELLWSRRFPEYVHATPAVCESLGLLYIGTNSGELHCLDAYSGETRWFYKTGGAVKEAAAIDEGRGFIGFGSFDGAVRILNLQDGDLLFEYGTGHEIYSTPLFTDRDMVVSSTDKALHLFSLDDGSHAQLDLGSKSVSSPVLIDDSIFVGSNSGAILEIDQFTSRIIGRHQLLDAVTSRISFCKKRKLFIAQTAMNEVTAFRREEFRGT